MRAVAAARQAATQRAHGKAREGALIAEATMNVCEEEETRRIAQREHTRRRTHEARAIEESRAAAAAGLYIEPPSSGLACVWARGCSSARRTP